MAEASHEIMASMLSSGVPKLGILLCFLLLLDVKCACVHTDADFARAFCDCSGCGTARSL